LFIDFCDSFDEDGMSSISLWLSIFSLHTSHYASIFTYSQYSIWDIPSLLSVIDYLWAMSFVVHASSELRNLNYDNFCIENVHCILSRFSGDVLFELPHVVSHDGHSGQMQWIGNMMAMRGARLRWLTSKTISTLLFGRHTA